MALPSRILIEKGKLKMLDGSSLVDYLKEWQDSDEIGDGAIVNVVTHKELLEFEQICNAYKEGLREALGIISKFYYEGDINEQTTYGM